MKSKAILDSISIVLVRPRFPENVGSVARAMKNMGLSRLVLVDGCSPLHSHAYKLASGAEDILERADEFPTVREAVADMRFVVGMTSRIGKERSPLLTPRALLKKIVPLSKGNPIALLFGSEKEGLMNEELSLCHAYVRIPASPSFSSLNLAQAVVVVCYELFTARMPLEEDSVELASSEQLEAMFDHMERTLLDIGFLEANHPKRIMRVLRRVFGRSQLNPREVQILQGIWSQVDRHLKVKQRRS